MLEVGNGNLSDEENRAHFSLWCLVKAPLLLGMDLDTLTADTKEIISNMNLIRVNQDPKSPQATCFAGCSVHADWSVLVTTTSDDAVVVLVINWKDVELKLQPISVYTVGVVPGPDETLHIRDLWTNEEVNFSDMERAIPIPVLKRHSCIVYELKAVRAQRSIRTEMEVPVLS
ncbi:PFAM glycoside hydrolase clan GH-D [Fragilaria crotonensis]|nr:PFAM glycoside hydrolase clan GH-D [Fragilaria crotonensis]